MSTRYSLLSMVKIGAIPSVLLGAVSFPINYYLLGIKYREEISLALGKPYYPSLTGLLIISIATTIVLAFCSILYILLYHKLLGGKAFTKAFIIGLAIYVFSRIGDFLRDYPVSKGLFIDNALLSAPLLLILYPYMLSKLYSGNK